MDNAEDMIKALGAVSGTEGFIIHISTVKLSVLLKPVK